MVAGDTPALLATSLMLATGENDICNPRQRTRVQPAPYVPSGSAWSCREHARAVGGCTHGASDRHGYRRSPEISGRRSGLTGYSWACAVASRLLPPSAAPIM